jgi:hypothetical protein
VSVSESDRGQPEVSKDLADHKTTKAAALEAYFSCHFSDYQIVRLSKLSDCQTFRMPDCQSVRLLKLSE